MDGVAAAMGPAVCVCSRRRCTGVGRGGGAAAPPPYLALHGVIGRLSDAGQSVWAFNTPSVDMSREAVRAGSIGRSDPVEDVACGGMGGTSRGWGLPAGFGAGTAVRQLADKVVRYKCIPVRLFAADTLGGCSACAAV